MEELEVLKIVSQHSCFCRKLKVKVGSTNRVKPPLFAMGNNISLDLPENHPSSVLDCLNENFELNEALFLAIMDLQVDEEGEIQILKPVLITSVILMRDLGNN